MKTGMLTLATTSLLFFLIGCNDRSAAPAADASTPAVETGTPAGPGWLLADMPAEARGVTELKTGASEGDTVVLRGRIGGGKTPMTPGSPIFTVVDLGLPSCAENPDDACPTPWDYCCEPREILTASTATVQLVDAAGSPLAADLGGVLSPLDEVVVVGTVAPRPNQNVLTVRATGVYRVGG